MNRIGIVAVMAVAALAHCGAAVKVSEAFGYDPEDSTRFLQAALDSPHREIIIDAQKTPWVALPLVGRSNKTILFEDGAWIRAKRGAYKTLTDCLLRFSGCTNVTLRGTNAKNCGLRMWRDDYDDPAQYKHSEWRHALAFHGCVDVTLEGFSANESGGDGLYVSSGPGMSRGCRNVKIRNCVFDRNYRQGISVIGVDGFVVEDTELTNTKGTPPQSGIDFEPNRPDQALCGIVMRRCLVAGNEGKGLDISHCNSGAITDPIDMLFEDCVVVGNRSGFDYGNGTHDQDVHTDSGEVVVRNCTFRDQRQHGINIHKHFNSGGKVTFENCTFENCWTTDPRKADIHLSVEGHMVGPPDVVVFRNVTVKQPQERPVLSYSKHSVPYRGRPTVIDGEVKCLVNGKETVFRYDEAWRRETFPFADVKMPPALPRVPAPLKGVTVTDVAPGEMRPCAALFVRGTAKYVFYAAKPGPVRFRFLQTLIGKGTYARARDIVVSRRGARKVLAKLEPPREPEGGEVTFNVPKAGFYELAIASGGNGMALVAATVPVALDATEGMLPLVGPGRMPHRRKYVEAKNRVWFCVREGEKVECDASSDGAETLGFEVLDPDGKSVVRVSAVDGMECLQPTPRPGVWSLVVSKPSAGCYEDHKIGLKGVPGWLFVSEGRYWR